MRAWALVKRAAPCLLALSLAGCFTSEAELVGYWGADTPLRDGAWAHWPTNPDGSEWERETWRGAIENQRRRYVSDHPDFPHEGVRFRRLHENIYLAQLPREDGVGYGVAWVYEDGDTVSYHQPACSDLGDARLAEHGVPLDPEGFCTVSDLDQLEAVMRAYLDAVGEAMVVDGVYRRRG
ncbi:MAG: hypothetical protein ACOC0V_05295 [Oceanicaulis sp.]